MKLGLVSPPRRLFPLCAALYLPLACSSSEAPNKIIPAPPTGGSHSGAGSPGTGGATSGSANDGGSSGSGGGGGGSAGGAACAKATDCPTGGFCKAMACACPMDKLDICESADNPQGACVSKMTDPNNCGMCGMKCEAGAACVAGVCGDAPAELGKSEGCGQMRLVIQGTDFYWTESMSGKVKSMPLAGGTIADVATDQLNPTQIVADADGIYWVSQGDGTTVGSSKLMKKALPIAGGEPVVLKASADAKPLLALGLQGGKLYYSHEHDVHQISTDEETTADIIVGSAINFDLNPPDGEPSGEPAGLALTDSMVFWTTKTRQGVEGDDLATGITGYVELGESQGSLLLSDLAAAGMYVYWANGEQFVRAVNTTKGNKPVSKTPDFDPITAFAVNATNVYFAGEKGLILKHDLMPPATDGEEPSAALAIARDQLKVSSLILDDTKVYWASDCIIRSTAQ